MTGRLSVVGMGPGSKDEMTVRADRILRECDVIAGYTLYAALAEKYYPDKEFVTTGMRKEEERCRMALDLARDGRKVALVCSGDSTVYGMAALCLELRGDANDVEIEVVPGLTAALTGGALLGAPLTNDFAVISLSDHLTPWEKIALRLRKCAEADMTIVIYNPASRTRPEHLRKACAILLEILPRERLCGIARNIGREGETARLLTLGELASADVDMFSTVFIGNGAAKEISGQMVVPRGYLR